MKVTQLIVVIAIAVAFCAFIANMVWFFAGRRRFKASGDLYVAIDRNLKCATINVAIVFVFSVCRIMLCLLR